MVREIVFNAWWELGGPFEDGFCLSDRETQRAVS
jgi:hypothetical protein